MGSRHVGFHRSFVALAAGSLMVSGVISGQRVFASDDSPPLPPSSADRVTVEYFRATPRTVPAGQAVVLEWKVTAGGSGLQLDGQSVPLEGTQAIAPSTRDGRHVLSYHSARGAS